MFHDVTNAELSVLQLLWRRGPCNVRLLTDELYPGGSEAHYATVKKLLERMEGKGCVRRDRTNSVHMFQATVRRGDLIRWRLRAIAESLCNGAMTPLLTHLVSTETLSRHEIDSLKLMLAEIETEVVEPSDRSETQSR